MNGYIEILGSRKTYNSWVLPSSRKRDDIISDNVPYCSRVLNYGCGTDTLSFLKKLDCEIVNYDVDCNNGIAEYHDFSRIPGRFKVTVLKEVVEHLTVGEMCKVFIDIAQISDSIILTTPNVFDTASRIFFEQDITHVRPYNTHDMEGILKKSGFPFVSAYVCDHIRAPHRHFLAKIHNSMPYASLVLVGKKAALL